MDFNRIGLLPTAGSYGGEGKHIHLVILVKSLVQIRGLWML